MPQVTRNGKAYDSADVVIHIDGERYDEIKDISYSTEQEHQVNHSLASDATSWSRGKINHKATVSIYMNDVVRLEKKGGGNLLNVKMFDVQVTFADELNEIINDTIVCKFQSQGRDVNGEMGLAQQFELFVIRNKYQTQ